MNCIRNVSAPNERSIIGRIVERAEVLEAASKQTPSSFIRAIY
jgi:hypothetical protein